MIPNAERVVIDYLREALDVPVWQTPPPAPPDNYVRLSRVGGIVRNIVTDAATMSISAYGKDQAQAAELANRVRELMIAARCSRLPGAWCRWWVEMAGPSYYPDPDRPDYSRYQFSGELRLATN